MFNSTTDYPLVGDVYRHFKEGREYRVDALAYDHNGEVVVVHTALDNDIVYTRTLSNFCGILPHDLSRRFKYVR